MTNSRQLRQCIAQVDGGELTDMPSGAPYCIVFPPDPACAVVYATKGHAANQLLASEDHELPIGLICRYGLPREEDIEPIITAARDHPIFFLGDCDPFDLLVFTWLREHLTIRFLGISDRVVSALGVDVTERITIPFSDEEQRAMLLVREVWPDFAASVGPNCARLLSGNRKLELEALVSFRETPHSNLLKLLQDE